MKRWIARLSWALFLLAPPAPGQLPLPTPVSDAPPVYVCPPCPHVEHLFKAQRHAAPGTCPVCGMRRVELPGTPGQSPVLREGPGAFVLQAGPGGTRRVYAFYYRPTGLQEQSPVLIVLPGAGRNAWTYRDHWIEAADAHGVLVVALHYPEDEYPGFWSYNLAGMLSDVEIDRAAMTMTDYGIERDPRSWLFGDLDAVFTHVLGSTGLKTAQYDLFGHSAGGQFLHRFALFAGIGARAGRIVAANSGWYTVPERGARFPYGLEDAPITDGQLSAALGRRLVVLLGAEDNEHERRGELVRNPQTDRQGTHRLARGRYFHARAAQAARDLGTRFDWTLEVVPGVGHDARGMADAAARLLYGDPPAPRTAPEPAPDAQAP